MLHTAQLTHVEPHERETFTRLLGLALHFPAGEMHPRIEAMGIDTCRALRHDGQIVAGLGLFPMGQWFGGLRVPVIGFTIVGVAPEHRGKGAGQTMMRLALEEVQAQGVPLAALYPATVAFYQRVGFGRAGQRFVYELPLSVINPAFLRTASSAAQAADVRVLPVGADAQPEFVRLYEQRARRSAGNIDRPVWLWELRMPTSDAALLRYLIEEQGERVGYCIFKQTGQGDKLSLHDVCTLTPAAARRLLAFFAGFRSMATSLRWAGEPFDPLYYLFGEPQVGVSQPHIHIVDKIDWMLRIVDVAGALTARGYAPGLRAELHFEVTDTLLPANAGRYVMTVADGRAQVERGGTGRIQLDICDMAALYSGFMHPAKLAQIGTLQAPEPDVLLAGAVFAGPRPWTSTVF